MNHANETEYFRDSAERAFTSNKFQEAIKIANFAVSTNPTENFSLQNLIPAYQVHLAASKKTSTGEPDWYAVLGIRPGSSDSSEIKKSYRKLALLVHPDKNKSLAAEGAFKLIGEAFEILSDSKLRQSFDDRRNSHRSSNYPTDQSTRPPAPEQSDTTECPACEHWRKNKPHVFQAWRRNYCWSCQIRLRRWDSCRKQKRKGWTNFYHA